MKTYTIPQKQSNSGSIHDIASDTHDREIVFRGDAKYAVVLASYYGGGYTTHTTEEATVKAARKVRAYSHTILDADGNEYMEYYGELVTA